MASRLVGAAMALAAGISAAVSAEPLDNSARAAPAARSVKPATAGQRAPVSQTIGARNTQARSWSIEDALPDKSSALNAPSTGKPQQTEFGRIPLHTGTLGIETKSQVNSYELPEARRIPSLENLHSKPSYLGLSLSVPTSGKLFSLPPFNSAGTRPD